MWEQVSLETKIKGKTGIRSIRALVLSAMRIVVVGFAWSEQCSTV